MRESSIRMARLDVSALDPAYFDDTTRSYCDWPPQLVAVIRGIDIVVPSLGSCTLMPGPRAARLRSGRENGAIGEIRILPMNTVLPKGRGRTFIRGGSPPHPSCTLLSAVHGRCMAMPVSCRYMSLQPIRKLRLIWAPCLA